MGAVDTLIGLEATAPLAIPLLSRARARATPCLRFAEQNSDRELVCTGEGVIIHGTA
jgi:hypothetical protein